MTIPFLVTLISGAEEDITPTSPRSDKSIATLANEWGFTTGMLHTKDRPSQHLLSLQQYSNYNSATTQCCVNTKPRISPKQWTAPAASRPHSAVEGECRATIANPLHITHSN